MGIHKLLERLGYVRLRDYGLILTPERRVLTTRSKVLDDGYGACVVGWADGDLATMELATWGEPKPVAAAPPPKLPAPPPPRPKSITVPPKPVAKPVAVEAAPVRAEPTRPSPPLPPEEDDWEWEIATARARASSEDIEPPPADDGDWEIAMARARALPEDVPPRRWVDDERTKTEVAPVTIKPIAQQLAERAPPRTIIPVPAMPAVDPRLVRSYEPPRRFPRATNPSVPAPRTSARR